MKRTADDSSRARERLRKEDASRRHYVLRLYVTGMTPCSQRAIRNIQNICEVHLKGRYELEIVDIYQQPVLAKDDQILAAPTLIKRLPLPLRRFIGDMSQKEKILLGLDLSVRSEPTAAGQGQGT